MLLLAAVGQQAFARGGGGCVQKGTPIATPAGPRTVESLKPGDALWSVVHGELTLAHVQQAFEVQPSQYIEITAGHTLLRVTPEHPIAVGPGEFTIASRLRAGQRILIGDGISGISTALIDRVQTFVATEPAYNLLVTPGGTYIAGGIVVHNKGCFLPDTPITLAGGGQIAISKIQPGQRVLAFESDGRIVETTVRQIITHDVEEHWLITAGAVTLRVTAEHPFYVGDGRFRTLESLKLGDAVYVYDGHALVPQPITQMQRIPGPVRVYNLQTDDPHTFLAHGVAVHNKGGGGGCFPGETLIDMADGSRKPIHDIQPGDHVAAFDEQGQRANAMVQHVYMLKAPAIIELLINGSTVRATAEHPFYVGGNEFRAIGALRVGDRVFTVVDAALHEQRVESIHRIAIPMTVFNLETDGPHTFVAGGFAVHNKGGGGFGGGGHSFGGGGFGGGWNFSGSGGTRGVPLTPEEQQTVQKTFMVLGGVVAVFVIVNIAKAMRRDEDLDYNFTRDQIEKKSTKTAKLIAFLNKQDPLMDPSVIEKRVRALFVEFQKCWTARNVMPLKDDFMPDLLAQHAAQVLGMINTGEINIVEMLQVIAIDIVNVRYMHKSDEREFTALITARARDYYVSDCTRRFLRGGMSVAKFQEFWTFQQQGGRWLLREIEQSRESDALKDENFVEMLTDEQLKAVYGGGKPGDGPAGPWLTRIVETKANRTERALNFLSQTDRLWNRQLMLERSREVFLRVCLARQSGESDRVPVDDLYPDVAEHLRAQIESMRRGGTSIEMRNLCVRKAELILFRNRTGKDDDEFVARISAHAQQIVRRAQSVFRMDDDVKLFVEYWTFGKSDGKWKLKEVLPPARGESLVSQENIDEESSEAQLQWYYSKNRAN